MIFNLGAPQRLVALLSQVRDGEKERERERESERDRLAETTCNKGNNCKI